MGHAFWADGPDGVLRPIDTVADVRLVLDSPKASFSELIRCVDVASAANDWELRHQAAERAFSLALGEGKANRIAEAAERYVRSAIRLAPDLSSLLPQVHAAQERLGRSVPPKSSAARALQSEQRALDELALLLGDGQTETLVRLSSSLRKFDRSDLAVTAARRAVAAAPENIAGLTTLAAGLADMQDHREGREVIERAIRLAPRDAPAFIVASRILQEMELKHDALVYAKRAFELDGSSFSAHRLLSAAAATDDRDAFEEAERTIMEHPDGPLKDDRWIRSLAVRVLIEAGKLGDARAALASLLKDSSSGQLAKQLSRLKSDLSKAERAQQGSLFDY